MVLGMLYLSWFTKTLMDDASSEEENAAFVLSPCVPVSLVFFSLALSLPVLPYFTTRVHVSPTTSQLTTHHHHADRVDRPPLTSSPLSVQVVANYYGNRKIYEPVPNKRIHWAGGRQSPPPDTPQCGFDGSGCPPDGKCLPLIRKCH